MGRIVSRLDEIRREKEAQAGTKLTWEAVAQSTGLAYSTVLKWAKGQVNRYDDDTLAKFCEYFSVQPGEILIYVSGDK